MALVIGTNAGFVTTAPTSDPDGGTRLTMDTKARGTKQTSPADATKVVEMGWWSDDATEEANFEVGIYTHDSGNNKPDAVVGSLSQTNAKGTTAGWKTASVDITISGSTTYWLCAQLDNTATGSFIDTENTGVDKYDYKNSQTTLPDPWGSSSGTGTRLLSIYAVYETATGTNKQINIGDAWKAIPAEQINISDAWKNHNGGQINISDAWKTLF